MSHTSQVRPEWLLSNDSTATESKNIDIEQSFGGQSVSLSCDDNFKEESRLQQDRIAAFTLPTPPFRVRNQALLKQYKDSLLEDTVEGAIEKCGEMITQGKITDGGSTFLMTDYDPDSYTVDLRSIGDSAAFLVADDGTKTVTTKISSTDHEVYRQVYGTRSATGFYKALEKTSVMANSIGATGGKPAYYNDQGILCAVYHLKPSTDGDINGTHVCVDEELYSTTEFDLDSTDLHHGKIDLHAFKQQIAAANEMDANKITLSLVVTSDGIMQEMPRQEIGKLLKNGGNAKTLVDACRKGSDRLESTDNLAVMVIDNLRPGVGDRVYALVCDGYDKEGHIVAQAALDVAKKKIENLRDGPLPAAAFPMTR